MPSRKGFNERLERKAVRDVITDPETGAELIAERVQEVVRSVDGMAIEGSEQRLRQRLSCGHLMDVGTPLAECALCSKRERRPIYVCANCAVQCPVEGLVICRRCAVLGPDGRYYSPAGIKKARKMGLFAGEQPQIRGRKSNGLLGGLLAFIRDWW